MKNAKRILCTVLSLVLIACLCAAPVSAADEAWKDAYRTAINNNATSEGSFIQLADFNLDGVPELLIGGAPGNGLFSVIQHAFTYRDGSIVELSIPDKYLKLGDTYELYRNDTTGEFHVEGSYALRSGYSTSSNITANYSIKDSAFVYESTFVSSVDLGKPKYTVGTETVTAGQYNNAYNTRHVGWSKVLFSVPNLSTTKKPTAAEIDGLLDGYKDGSVLAVSSSHKLTLNGSSVSAAAYTINGSNYFKLRDLAIMLKDTGAQFEVGYDSATRAITLTTGQPYSSGDVASSGSGINQLGIPTPSAIYIDGESVELTGYNIGGSNYFKLRDLGDGLGFEVGWNDAKRTVSITA